MTKVLGENANRDLFVGPNNQLVLLTDLEATLQACASAIETQRGEVQYNTSRGVPTSQTLWSGTPNHQRFQFYALEALRGVAGVREIKQFETEIVDDAFTYTVTIETIFGTGTIGNTLNAV